MPDRSADERFRDADLRFMRLALQKAQEGMDGGGSPFGAVVVRGGEVVAVEHNVVLQTHDPTAHAEVTALRAASKALGTHDLAGCTIYSTTEPCPMCFSAIHWAHCDRIVFGAAIADAGAAGFRELAISNEEMKRLGGATLEVEGGVMAEEARAQFRAFVGKPDHRTY
jgi:tRNA(Arg) A34 adenosine deaminase TadA